MVAYVFYGPNATRPAHPAAVQLPVPPASWRVPPFVRLGANPALGVHDYRVMGWWRLAFQFQFAAAVGHSYALQTDGDMFMTADVNGQADVVAAMRARQAALATYCDPCFRGACSAPSVAPVTARSQPALSPLRRLRRGACHDFRPARVCALLFGDPRHGAGAAVTMALCNPGGRPRPVLGAL